MGAQLRLGCVTDVVLDAGRTRALGVKVDGVVLEADAIVIAMGPWSMAACQWLPLPAVYGLKGNSVVYQSGSRISADALFVELTTADGAAHTPEVFPRADGTTYVCGLSSQQVLPDDPADVVPDPGAQDALQSMTRVFAPALADTPIVATQACFRPVTQDGLPLLGPVPGVANAFVATGHSVWGILNAPASGEAMAELIVDGATEHVDLRRFDPARRRDEVYLRAWSSASRPPWGGASTTGGSHHGTGTAAIRRRAPGILQPGCGAAARSAGSGVGGRRRSCPIPHRRGRRPRRARRPRDAAARCGAQGQRRYRRHPARRGCRQGGCDRAHGDAAAARGREL